MTPLEKLLRAEARRLGVGVEVLMKDYAIGHVLGAVAAEPTLADTLVFKGGTALKKLYFGDYRFSEDLDFTALGAPSGPALEATLRGVAGRTLAALSARGPFVITVERQEHRDPHPAGQEAFDLRVQYPWQRTPLCIVKLEITADEPVVLPPDHRPILHGYNEAVPGTLAVYRLDEIVAEKLRAVLQCVAGNARRRWTRSRPRDYYDLWRILREPGATIDAAGFPDLLSRKCAVRDVSYDAPADFFPAALVDTTRETWVRSLGALVPDLPPFDTVLDALIPRVTALLAQ
jgi:predicted nucleotidyltransferase component of viral defense system